MIESLREFATSWVAKVLLVVLVASFAVWGVQLTAFGGNAVASIGDEEVSVLEFRRDFDEVLRQINDNNYQRGMQPFTPQQAVAAGVHHGVIASLQQEKALGQEVAALGIDAPDEPVKQRIENSLLFQVGGAFNREIYERELQQRGYRRTEFEERERRRMAIGLLSSAVGYGATAPDAVAETLWRRRSEIRRVGHLTLTLDDVETPEDPGDAVLQAHLGDNPDRFTRAERRTVELLWIRPSELADIDAVEETEIVSVYEAAGERFNAPERRNLERLYFPDRAEAEAAAARIQASGGPSLAEVAAERGESDDIALGYVTREQLAAFTPEQADIAFAPDVAGLVGPIASGERFALINVAGVQPERSTPLEDVRDEIARNLAIDAARRETSQLANAIEDSRAAGVGFEEIAEQRGVVYQVLDIDRAGRGADGLRVDETPNDVSFFNRVFEQLIGEETDLAQTQDQQYWTAVVTDIEPAQLRGFDEARPDVLSDWTEAQRIEALDEAAEAARARLEAGEDLEAVAADLGVAAEIEEQARRFGGGALSQAARGAAFARAREEAVGAAAVVRIGPQRQVLTVLAVETPDPTASFELETEHAEASAALSREIQQLFETAVTSQRDAEMYPSMVDAALTDMSHY